MASLDLEQGYVENSSTDTEYRRSQDTDSRSILAHYKMTDIVGFEFRNEMQDYHLITGGLQQLLNKEQLLNTGSNSNSSTKVTSVTCRATATAAMCKSNITDLPDSLLLQIFGNLPLESLCLCGSVCRHWYDLSWDRVLWSHRLSEDMHEWKNIGSTTNPLMYKQAGDHPKDIYLRCSPYVNEILRERSHTFRHFTNVLRTLLPHKSPTLAMFGPGLESASSIVVRRLIQDQNGVFKVAGLFPGMVEGVGSGFNMKMNNTDFNLSTLYTSTRQEREARENKDRLVKSKLMTNKAGEDSGVLGGNNGDGGVMYEVRQAVKDFTNTVDGFVYVIDATMKQHEGVYARAELHAMVRCSGLSVPVLILLCVPPKSQPLITPIDLVKCLDLANLVKPWMVYECNADTLEGIPQAFDWVIGQANRR